MDLIRAKSVPVTRSCLSGGQWASKANYNACIQFMDDLGIRTDQLDMRNRRLAILIFSGSLVSLALLALTLYIFVSFRYVENFKKLSYSSLHMKNFNYHTCAIITRCLYTFYPL